MIRFLSRLLLGALWLATLPAHAQSLLPAQEGAVPSSEGIVQGSGHGSVYSLGKNGALTATLRVRDDASVSDPDWLQIEINNPGDMGTLTDWRFELFDVTVVPAVPANKAEPPPVNKTASVGISHGVQSLPKGKFILPDNPATLAAATLGLPAQGVWRVRANARLVLKAWADYEVGESLFPAKTVPIEFVWRTSPDPGNEAQLQWLRQYLASANLENNSALDTSDYQRAVALLKTPAIVMAINPDDLISAIDRSKNRPRENLVRLLDEVWASDARVVAHYRQALADGDVEAERDLNNYAPDVWADNFVEPLVGLVEKKIRDGTTSHHLAVLILEKHYPVWAKDAAIGPRLHRALEEEPAYVGGNSGSASLQFLSADPEKWSTQVQLLAYTHDPTVIPELRPFLDNKMLVLDGQIESSGQALSTRMCDYAHDAILHILGEIGEFGVLQKGGFVNINDPAATGMGNSGPHNWIWPRWDNGNAALAKYLDAAPNSASSGAFGADTTVATEVNVAEVRGQLAALAANLHFFESKNIARNRGAIMTYPDGQISQLMMMNSIPTPNEEWPESLNQEHTQLAIKLHALSSQHAALLALLKEHDPKIRTLALGALFDREDPKDLPTIAALINDTDATWPIFNFTASKNSYTEGSQPQCVGDVAATLVRFYLVAANILDKSDAKPSPQGRAEIAGAFAKYWAQRANRDYCASWFVVKYARASGNELSVPDDRQATVAAVLAQINALPPVERAWTELYVFKSDFILTDNASDGMVVKSLKAGSPEAILQFLQHQPVTDDPDLRFVDSSSTRNQFSWMATFLLEHATELLRPEDADAVAALVDAGTQQSYIIDVALCQKASAALKAEQKPAPAATTITTNSSK